MGLVTDQALRCVVATLCSLLRVSCQPKPYFSVSDGASFSNRSENGSPLLSYRFHQPKPTTSEFFRYFKQKFKLVVSKSSMLVTGNTVFQCNLCSQEFDVDSVKAMSSHVLGHHSPPTPFCFFCEKRVSDLDLHLHDDESEQLHELRLRGLATVGCKSEVNALKQDAFCSNCTNRFHSDPGLPDWLATISCRKCMWSVVSAIRPKMVTQAKRVLVSCSFCHHNKFGHHLPKTAKLSGLSSICTNCFVLLNSFLAESGEECEKYVRGMLNELVSSAVGKESRKGKLAGEEIFKSFHPDGWTDSLLAAALLIMEPS